VSGGDGRIWVTVTTKGYDVSISGATLEYELYNYMRLLCGRDCDGYKKSSGDSKNPRQPFWRVADFSYVKKYL